MMRIKKNRFLKGAENVAFNERVKISQEAVNTWLKSSGHRSNEGDMT
jgi:uncharacterized protein YkwD